jgi:hypothetical protein
MWVLLFVQQIVRSDVFKIIIVLYFEVSVSNRDMFIISVTFSKKKHDILNDRTDCFKINIFRNFIIRHIWQRFSYFFNKVKVKGTYRH